MAKKSNVRLHTEAALVACGINFDIPIYVDKSKSGHQVKFCWRTANRTELKTIHRIVSTLNPGHEVQVWNHRRLICNNYNGLCVKIFNK